MTTAKARASIRCDAVFDIETEAWDKPLFAGILYSDGEYRDYSWKNIDDFFDALLAIDGTVWAHYGGGFDIKAVLDYCVHKRKHVSIASAGSLIRMARVGKTIFRDSFAMFPASLADFTKGLPSAKTKTKVPCTCGKACPGFCNFARNKPQYHEKIRTYLKQDCVSLMAAINRLDTWSESVDVDLAPTVGLSAWKFAHRRFNVPKREMSGHDFTFARESYYGGRVEVFRWGAQANVFEADVRSMYPSALHDTALPSGPYSHVRKATATRHFAEGREGCYRCNVTVPKMHIPPLPYRTPKRIYFPTGTFDGVWTKPELDYAISLGVKVNAITEALTSTTNRPIFREWATEVFRVRHEECGGPDTPLGGFAKFLANAVTGKLAQNPDRYAHEINPANIVVCKCTDKHQKCECNPHEMLSPQIFRRKVTKLSDCMHPLWAAYLTAVSRVKLHRKLSEAGANVCYCDTDSVFALQCDNGAMPFTAEKHAALGEFELKGLYSKCYFAAPKVYEKDGKVKAKGVRGVTKLSESKLQKSEGIIGFGAGTRKGVFFRKGATSRRLTFHAGGRIILNRQGDTRAMTIEEVRLDQKKRKIESATKQKFNPKKG